MTIFQVLLQEGSLQGELDSKGYEITSNFKVL